MSAVALPNNEYRGFTIYDRMPAGCFAFPIIDHYSLPHLRMGEFVVVNPSDIEPRNGEVYVIQWDGGRRCVCQARICNTKSLYYLGEETWMVGSIRRPDMDRFLAQASEAAKRGAIMVYPGWSEGPFRGTDYLKTKLVGRVIGLFVETAEGPMRDVTPAGRS